MRDEHDDDNGEPQHSGIVDGLISRGICHESDRDEIVAYLNGDTSDWRP